MAFVSKTTLEDGGAGMSEATAGDFFALLKPRKSSARRSGAEGLVPAGVVHRDD